MLKAQGHVWKLLQPMQTNPEYMCIDFCVTDRNSEWLKEQACRARTAPDELTFQLRAETTIRDMLRGPYVARLDWIKQLLFCKFPESGFGLL